MTAITIQISNQCMLICLKVWSVTNYSIGSSCFDKLLKHHTLYNGVEPDNNSWSSQISGNNIWHIIVQPIPILQVSLYPFCRSAYTHTTGQSIPILCVSLYPYYRSAYTHSAGRPIHILQVSLYPYCALAYAHTTGQPIPILKVSL